MAEGLEFGGGCREISVGCVAPLGGLDEEIVCFRYFLLGKVDFRLCGFQTLVEWARVCTFLAEGFDLLRELVR